MAGFGDRKPNELSGGQKQRVAIARALVKLVIIVSHDREFAEEYADRIITLSDGNVINDVTRTNEEVRTQDTEKDLIFEKDNIKISKDYQLTEEDRIKINAYIKNYNGD